MASLKDLRSEAAALNIEGRSKMSREDLEAAIFAAQVVQTPEPTQPAAPEPKHTETHHYARLKSFRWREMARNEGLSPRAIQFLARWKSGKCNCPKHQPPDMTVEDLVRAAMFAGYEIEFIIRERDHE